MVNHEPVRGTNKVRMTADTRKGSLSVGRDPNDSSVHITWTDRATGAKGLDLMVFPNDVTFKRISTGNNNDRVYELKYKETGSRAYYFWMQTFKSDEDEANARKCLQSIDNPPVDGLGGSGVSGGEAGSANPLLSGLGRAVRPAGPATSTSAATPGLAPDMLAAALRQMGVPMAPSPAGAPPPGTVAPAAAVGTPAAPPNAPARAPVPDSAIQAGVSGVGLAGSGLSAGSEPVPPMATLDPGARPSQGPPSGISQTGAGELGVALDDIEDEEVREAIRLSMMEGQQNQGQGGQGGQGGQQ